MSAFEARARTLTVSAVVVGVVVTTGAVACRREGEKAELAASQEDHSLDEKSFDAAAIALVQERVGLRLPDGARGLHMFYQGASLDPAFVAKILVPSSSREQLVRSIEAIEGRGGLSTSLSTKVAWWRPSPATIIAERRFAPDGDYVHIIMCEDAGRLVLYIEWASI